MMNDDQQKNTSTTDAFQDALEKLQELFEPQETQTTEPQLTENDCPLSPADWKDTATDLEQLSDNHDFEAS